MILFMSFMVGSLQSAGKPAGKPLMNQSN